jgi:hypothetical protein
MTVRDGCPRCASLDVTTRIRKRAAAGRSCRRRRYLSDTQDVDDVEIHTEEEMKRFESAGRWRGRLKVGFFTSAFLVGVFLAAVATAAPEVNVIPPVKLGDGGPIFAVVVAQTDEAANATVPNYTEFRELTSFNNKPIRTGAAYTELFQSCPQSFTRSFDDSSFLVFVCYNGKTGALEDGKNCIADLNKTLEFTVIKPGVDKAPVPVASDAIAAAVKDLADAFNQTGWGILRTSVLTGQLRHGDVVRIRAMHDGAIACTYYGTYRKPHSLAGKSGFQIPVYAFGGIKTNNGIKFSLLAPAVSFGGERNFRSDDFQHLGYGLLVSGAIVESESSSGKDNQSSSSAATSGFSLARVATAVYIDLGGYVWLGGGARFSFVKGENTQGLVLLTFGESVYKALFTPSK